MTIAEKKQYLRQYRLLNAHIDQLIEERAQWMARATRITPVISDEPKGGGDGDRLQRAIEGIISTEQAIDREIDRLADMRANITASIDALQDEKLRQVIRLRYIKGLTFERIAVEVHYSYKQTCRLHGMALESLDIEGCP